MTLFIRYNSDKEWTDMFRILHQDTCNADMIRQLSPEIQQLYDTFSEKDSPETKKRKAGYEKEIISFPKIRTYAFFCSIFLNNISRAENPGSNLIYSIFFFFKSSRAMIQITTIAPHTMANPYGELAPGIPSDRTFIP